MSAINHPFVETVLSLLPGDDTKFYFCLWLAVWIIVIVLPPGTRSITTAYKLNFLHGLLSSLMAVLSFMDKVPQNHSAMVSASYFVVDITNGLINDFIFRVPSYQKGLMRIVEYIHHFLSITVIIYSGLYYRDICSIERDPTIYFMLAESSTPCLIAWRQFGGNILAGVFAINFVAIRIVYHCCIFLPNLVANCQGPLTGIFAFIYISMNLYFLYTIVRKFLSMFRKHNKKGKKQD